MPRRRAAARSGCSSPRAARIALGLTRVSSAADPPIFEAIPDVADMRAEIAIRERRAARNVDRGRRGLALAEQRKRIRDRFERFVHGFAIRHVPGRLIVL